MLTQVTQSRIPYTTLPNGKTLQDWDTIDALDIQRLSTALAHLREHGALPPYLTSIQDLNQETECGVAEGVVEDLRAVVAGRLAKAQGHGGGDGKRTLAFLEGILLYSPPVSKEDGEEGKGEGGHILRPIHQNIDVRLFLPTAYEDVKTRREARTGYATSGPAQQPALPQRTSSSVDAAFREDGQEEQKEENTQPQTFWQDPPGYVDDIVWPHYVQDHAWLLLPENEPWRDVDTEELVMKVGRGVDARTDLGVAVAPGKGSKPMTEVLTWAVEEVLKYWENV